MNLNIAAKPLPEKHVWLEYQNNLTLLKPRQFDVAILLRLAMLMGLIAHVPTYLIVIWLAASIAAHFHLLHLSTAYSKLLEDKSEKMTDAMIKVVEKYKQAWLIKSATWAFSVFLYVNWVPQTSQLFCVVVILILASMSITRTLSHQRLMNQVSEILIGSQIFFTVILLILKINDDNHFNFQTYRYDLSFIGGLMLAGYFIVQVGNRMYALNAKHLNSEYANLHLIEMLKKTNLEQRVDQQALIAADQEIQRFYSAAAHDLRQPVYAMEIYVDMMANEPASALNYVPKIKQSCESINTMFDSLFDFQKIHALDMSSNLRDISIADMFKNLEHHYAPIARTKNLTLRFKPIDGSVHMVPMYLIRILSNLITNAIRYTQTGGVLVVVRKHEQLVSFEIWDTGIGIDQHHKQQIFEEFYKVNNPLSHDEGFGIGLSIVKQLVMQIKGAAILVESKPGKGSVFKFQVPLAIYSEN